MCTRALWSTDAGDVFVGRNMDWLNDMQTNLWAFPAGIERDGLVPGAATWTASYGSVVAGAYDVATTDGMNTAGLAAHVLWLAESSYGERDLSRPGLVPAIWAQYFLDCFATVADAVASLASTPIQLTQQVDPFNNQEVTVHLILSDVTGDSAVIECIDGRMDVHHDRAYTVATNSPPFAEQRKHLLGFEGFGGTAPLPGTTEAADRFVRASYYVERLPQPLSDRHAVAEILSVMRNAAQPFGTVDPARPNISSTIWRTVSSLSRGLYFFESSFSPNIVWADINGLDLSAGQPVRKLDLQGHPDLVGDVTGAFEPAEPFAFLGAVTA